MGNESSSLEGLEAVLVDPSLILGESQQAISMRAELAAQSSSSNTYSLTLTNPNPQAIPLLVPSSREVESRLHIPMAAGPHEESQLREAEPEILDILNPVALFPSGYIDDDEEPIPPTQALAQFEATAGYINFLLIIILINYI